MSFLDPTAIARLETLPVKARLIVEGALTGLHRAKVHGASVEFAEHKEYTPGDEIRHIDWKAYGKLDRFYVKQFDQESQLTAYLVLDASRSMTYRGDGISKLEYASYLLAALAYLLIRQRDKVGLCVFGDPRVHAYVPPRARPRHLADLLAVIDSVNAASGHGAEQPGDALRRIAELSRRRRALVVLASDLFEAPRDGHGHGHGHGTPGAPGAPALDTLRHLVAQRHDVALFHTLDPHELSFPFDGMTLFESLEDDRKLLVNAPAVRRSYMRRLEEFLGRVERACEGGGIEYHRVATSTPIEQTLLEFLSLRTRLNRPRTWSF